METTISNPAEYVVSLFDSASKLASTLGVYPSTVTRWVAAGRIPSKWHRDILDLAGLLGLDITPSDLILGRGQ